jgi:endonuclease YncB( thermonuclease family)
MNRCSRSATFLLIAYAALICHSNSSFAETRTLEGIVVHVADGDTITVLDSNKVGLRSGPSGW